MATWGPALATVLAAVIAFVSNLTGIRYTKRLKDSEGRKRPRYRTSVVDRWGWVSIGASVLAVAAVGLVVRTAMTWIAGGVAVVVCAAIVAWWGWRSMPLLSIEVLDWWRSRPDESDAQGGLPYRREVPGLAERTYAVQGLSEVDDLAGGRSNGRTRGEVLTPDELLADGRHVLVTGEAGVGKSTNLRHFGSEADQEAWVDATRGSGKPLTQASDCFPVLLSARDLVGQKTIEAALGSAPEKMLSRAPARGVEWLVLVDAVDEVLNTDQRQQVWELLLKVARNERPFRLVISSRSVDSNRWLDLRSCSVAHYQLHPFTEKQLRAFAVRHQSGRVDPAEPERPEVEQRAAEFLGYVRGKGLIDVVRLPLLAKLAADLYFDRQRHDLPLRRVDLYEHSIKQWLAKFDDVLVNQVLRDASVEERDDVYRLLGNLDEAFPEAAKNGRSAVLRAFLTQLAYDLLDYLDVAPELVDVAVKLMNPGPDSIDPTTRLAVGRVLEATGLIRDPYHDAQFWHQTFAEYIAAPKLAKTVSGSPGDWTLRLGNPDTYPGTVFAFHYLSKDRQYRLIHALSSSWSDLPSAAILATEGLCDAASLDLIFTGFLGSDPEMDQRGTRSRSAIVARWRAASILVDFDWMNWKLRRIATSTEEGFGDRVRALAVLADSGDEECRETLDSYLLVRERKPISNRLGVEERAHLADALSMVDMRLGVDALVKLTGDAPPETFDVANVLRIAATIEEDLWSIEVLAMACNTSVDFTVRLNLAAAVARAGHGRGLTVMAAMSRDSALSEEQRDLVLSRLAKTYVDCPPESQDVLARDGEPAGGIADRGLRWRRGW